MSSRSKTPAYLMVDGSNVRIIDASHLKGQNVLDVYDALKKEFSSDRMKLEASQSLARLPSGPVRQG